jgi:sugar O-acyltransferase (sialic acid O-acetyltransferase NeuD family)
MEGKSQHGCYLRFSSKPGSDMALIIVGAGGFGREIYQYALDTGQELKGFLDDNAFALTGFPINHQVLGTPSSYDIQLGDRFVLAVGDPATKKKLAQLLEDRGALFESVVHPLAYIAPSAHVMAGCVVAPFAFLGPSTRIEEHVSVNTYASAGHDSTIGRYSTLSPYSVINGCVQIAQGVLLATHAVVVLGKNVGSWSKLSAGAVALHNIPEYSLAVGNPAKSQVMFAPDDSSTSV